MPMWEHGWGAGTSYDPSVIATDSYDLVPHGSAALRAEPDHAALRAEPDHAALRAEPDHAALRAEPDHGRCQYGVTADPIVLSSRA